jgi:phosphopentomutase
MPNLKGGDLGNRSSFADVAASVLEAFGIVSDLPDLGKSFLDPLS